MTTQEATADRREETRPGVLEPRGPARFIADPVALGLGGFGLTTMTLGCILIGFFKMTALPVVLPLALAYGGIAQLLAGMWAFIRGDTFGALGFSSYGAFWISFWALNTFYLPKIPMADRGGVQALYLAMWGVFTFYLWIASFRVSVMVNLVLLPLWVAYGLLAAAFAGGSTSLMHIGGGFTMATAAIAWYVSFATVLEATFGKAILPLVPTRQVQQDPPGT